VCAAPADHSKGTNSFRVIADKASGAQARVVQRLPNKGKEVVILPRSTGKPLR
jgi:hypothetical protein